MRKTEAKKHYGTCLAIAKALGVTIQATSKWGPIVPFRSALLLNELTEGKLKMARNRDYDHHLKPRKDVQLKLLAKEAEARLRAAEKEAWLLQQARERLEESLKREQAAA
jgi:hypothetical protein